MEDNQNVKELLSKIEQCNKQIAEINRKTAVEIGRKKEITENLEKMLAQYKEKYGVELSLGNKGKIEEEYKKVISERAEQAEKMEKVLSYVEQGKYTEVNLMLGVSMSQEEDRKTELKTTLVSQANKAGNITTTIDIGGTESTEIENQGSTTISFEDDIAVEEQSEEITEEVIKGVTEQVNTVEETAEEQSETITEEIIEGVEKQETHDSNKSVLEGFSFENLLNNPKAKVEDNTSEDSDGSSFFTLPNNGENTFSNFGNIVSGTRFQPK